jgi:hypothetical protein
LLSQQVWQMSKQREKSQFGLSGLINTVIVVAVAIYFSLFFLHEGYFTNLDQAKLVKYGEVILEQGRVFSVNLFSYTAPDYPFINHHWGVGVIFYLIHWVSGLEGLTVAVMLINLLAMLWMLYMAKHSGNLRIGILIVLFMFPLLTARPQPRPEMFSLLFFVLNITLLHAWYNRKLPDKFLWALPLMQLIWVNLHILFYFGLFLQGVMLLQLMLHQGKRQHLRFFAIIFFAGIAATFINPAFAKGLFYPLLIMGDIRYAVSENMTLFQVYELKRDTVEIYHIEASILLALLFLWYWIKNPKQLRTHLYLFIWLTAFLVLFFWKVRANVFFAYLMVLVALHIADSIPAAGRRKAGRIALVATLLVVIVARLFLYNLYDPYKDGFLKPGLGLDEKMAGGADYFIKNELKGPIFNNFDIGDYLIYHLYPQEKVFVDGRPEAYPPEFFSDKLVPALFEQRKWLDLNYEYKFNVVFLGYHTQVLGFVQRLFYDDGWFLAYRDEYTIIFLRRGRENDHLVRRELLQRSTLREIEENFRRNYDMMIRGAY